MVREKRYKSAGFYQNIRFQWLKTSSSFPFSTQRGNVKSFILSSNNRRYKTFFQNSSKDVTKYFSARTPEGRQNNSVYVPAAYLEGEEKYC
ncbi:hypothetical protein TNIN_289311 [Trichonephila inaurata madagascariensis]|nr:hypothetical protein TNIN_289311 [Trichonephila inaurata madagascariensis]